MRQRLKQTFDDFFNSEPAAGIVLIVAALIGIVLANSPWADSYFYTLNKTYIAGLSVLHWINDGLMAIFFLYVGLEVKRELISGELSTNAKRLLPGVAAVAGVTVPALIYIAFNIDNPDQLRGWASPAATDIAFALGVLALLGSRVPLSLKVFLTALAVIDDLIVIVIIALFYTDSLQMLYLGLASAVVLALVLLNRRGVRHSLPYMLLEVLMWFLVLKSGIHATLAGVVLALTMPLQGVANEEDSLLIRWEHALSNWVAFLIVPIFGLANAGVAFGNFEASQLLDPVVLGIAAGLFFGKQCGIFGIMWLLVKTGIAQKPEGASWAQIYGVSLLCGIGFTMSLFIGALAFSSPEVIDLAKIGVFAGSIAAAILGYVVLRLSSTKA